MARAARWRHTLGYGLVLVVVAAHTLRNVSWPAYSAAWVAAAVVAVVAAARSGWRERLADRGWVAGLWLALVAWGTVTTAVVSGPASAVQGASRYVFGLPVLLALVAFTDSRRELLRHITLTVVVFALLALTLPAQMLLGPVPFFSEPSVRAGQVRYASAVGSLTALGIAVGGYAVLCQLLPRRWRWLALLVLSGCATVSLSKAAIGNVALAFLATLWLQRRDRRAVAGLLVGLLLAGAAVAALPGLGARLGRIVATYVGGDRALLGDLPLTTSLLQRLTVLPAQNWADLLSLGSPVAPLTGGGFAWGGTALVGADVARDMAHNQLVESLSVFGLLGGGLQLGLLGVCALSTWLAARRSDDVVPRVACAGWLLLGLNSLLANGTLYQPLSAVLLWLLVFVATSTRIGKETADG